MVARGVGSARVPPTWKPDEQDAGDHKGPPNPTSAALAPTDVDGLGLRLMPLGRPSRSPWQSFTDPTIGISEGLQFPADTLQCERTIVGDTGCWDTAHRDIRNASRSQS